MPKYKFQRDDILSKSEVEAMVAVADPPMKALIGFLYIFGCRISEALNLVKTDVTVNKKTVVVRLLTLKRKERGAVLPHRLNTVKMGAPFLDVFLAHLGMVSEGKIWRMSRVTAWRRIKKLNPKCSPHIFRHTRATKFALAGADIPELWAWFNWVDMNTGAKYIHASGRLASKLSGKVD